MKIVIVIDGGVCQSVFCDEPQAEVEVIDWDNIREASYEAEIAEIEAHVADIERDLVEVA
jgi:hypothetical protein